MELGLVFARARNGVIGKDGSLPWHLPEDLAHFKAVTQGCPVIMGRKTWDSLPPRFRPLPGRRNLVVTRQTGWQAPGAERAGSLEEAIGLASDAPRAWVIGGAELYRLALAHATLAEITEVDQDFEGDAYAPELGDDWEISARRAMRSAQGIGLSFSTWRRTRPA
jgi:dihydrofolate reductase